MALASAVVPGKSLAGTSIEQISHNISTNRNVSIEISNLTEYSLEIPKVYTFSGYCLNPPQPTIPPKTAEACAFTKTSDTACGSVGVLAYQILTPDRHLVGNLTIMFSVPYDYNWYENWFALGINETECPCNKELYEKMYYGSGAFQRGKATGTVLTYSTKHACVKGTMSPAGKSIMKIELWDNSSNPAKKRMCPLFQCCSF